MAFVNPALDELCSILTSARTIAVIGLSDNPERVSYAIAKAMQAKGYRIIPVNPGVDTVLGEPAVARVTDIEEPIDIINVFRRSEVLPEVFADCIKTTSPVIWCQQGVYHEEAAIDAQRHGKTVIMDLCIAVMHSRLVTKG